MLPVGCRAQPSRVSATLVFRAICFAAFALAVALPPGAVAGPPAVPFVVDWPLDEPDASTADGLCRSTPSLKCTLRAAVQQSNTAAGPNLILLGLFLPLVMR